MLNQMLSTMELAEGMNPTALSGLEIYKISKPFPKIRTVYPCSICFIVQGSKSVYVGKERTDYGEGQFLISSVTMPAESELREASIEKPYLGIIIKVNSSIISQLLLEVGEDISWVETQSSLGLLKQGTITEQIDSSLVNLLSILQSPMDYKVLGYQQQRDIYYRILLSPIGYLLRNSAIQNAKAHKIAPLIQFIEHNFRQPITIQELVTRAGMSTTSLHALFKQTTSLSPIQFIKKIRLHHAHTLLQQGYNASESAYDCGYSSATQFSREFKREYGVTPSKLRASTSHKRTVQIKRFF